jgi:hypothetical protein
MTGFSEQCTLETTYKTILAFVRYKGFQSGNCEGHFVWNVMACSPVKVHRRFGRTYCPHLLDRRVSQASNQRAQRLLFTCLAYYTILKIEAVSFSETSMDFYRQFELVNRLQG